MKPILRNWLMVSAVLLASGFLVPWSDRNPNIYSFLTFDWRALLPLLVILAWIRVRSLKLEARPLEGLALFMLGLAVSGFFLSTNEALASPKLIALSVVGPLSLSTLAYFSMELWAEIPIPYMARSYLGLAAALGALWVGLGSGGGWTAASVLAIAPKIISPTDGAVYELKPSLDLDRQRVPLTAQVAGSEGRLYWFMDDALLGDGGPDETLFWVPSPGSHSLEALDNDGRSSRVHFKVSELAGGGESGGE